MARRIRVPGIVDVVLVSTPEEIRALDDQPAIDRNFIARGPLVNRLITGRIRRWFQIMGQLLPSLLPRRDQVRADRQQHLAAALDPAQGAPWWSDEQIAALKEQLRGKAAGQDVELAVKVDPAIIGGLVVKLGIRMIDTSLRTKLNAIRHAMKEAR